VQSEKIAMSCFVKQEQLPKGVPYILWNIFFDRFSSGGFIVIIAIYLNQKLQFDQSTSTAIYHINEFFLYFFSIVGAMIADSYLGIYKTLTVMSLLCACSATIISVASLELSFLPIRVVSFIGLAGAMIGMGCVKSNQNVFGGNQFKPEQSKMLDYYFSMHYFTMKCGQVGGMILMPVLREDVKCFGKNDCYPLAFGVITLLMALAVIILCIGRKSFVHVPPNGGNIVIAVLGCIKVRVIILNPRVL
jgi:solute carrier family 15 oligopeptide transporter 1